MLNVSGAHQDASPLWVGTGSQCASRRTLKPRVMAQACDCLIRPGHEECTGQDAGHGAGGSEHVLDQGAGALGEVEPGAAAEIVSLTPPTTHTVGSEHAARRSSRVQAARIGLAPQHGCSHEIPPCALGRRQEEVRPRFLDMNGNTWVTSWYASSYQVPW